MSEYGKATGPIRFHFIGDEPAARQRIGEGRAFLGQVKEFMRLSEIKSYHAEAVLHSTDTDKDIGVVRAKSNNNGLAAIDEVWITVPKLPKEKKGGRKCLGYIVQCLVNESKVTGYPYIYADYDFELHTPSGKELITKDLNELSTGAITYAGFPDNNARYATLYKYDDDSGDLIEDPDFQVVLVIKETSETVYTGLGPISNWTVENYDETWPTLNPGWVFVSEYTYESGQCGTDPEYGDEPVVWVEETTVCDGPVRASINYYSKPAETYLGDKYIGKATHYSGAHYHVSLPFFPDQCARETGSHLNFDGPGGVSAGQMNTHNWMANKDKVLSAVTEASRLGYEDHMTYRFNNDGPNMTYDMGLFAFSSTRITKFITRRSDSHGFINYSGFKLADGKVIFTDKNLGDGEGALFMLPSGKNHRYKYSDELQQMALDSGSQGTQNFNDVGASGGGMIPCDLYNTYYAADREVGIVNVTANYNTDYEIQDLFGIPVKVEDGVHSVGVSGNSGTVKVWLLIEDSEQGTYFHKVSIEFDKDGTDAIDITAKIKVGEFTDVAELVSFK